SSLPALQGRPMGRGATPRASEACFSEYVFFFNDTATTEIYTLSLHDALPIWQISEHPADCDFLSARVPGGGNRSEEHTSELQSLTNLVCRLLLEKNKQRS